MESKKLQQFVLKKSGRIEGSIFSLCLIGSIFLNGCSGNSGEQQTAQEKPANAATIPQEGGLPKAIVEEPVYNFGVMEAGEELEHVFLIRNDGDGKLILTPGQATCKCTKFELDKKELEPGDSAKATVRWRPVEVQDKFRQAAPISTNDPDHPEIQLNIHGAVKSIFTVKPDLTWQLGDFREGEEKEFPGYVFCNVDSKFEIEDLKTSNPAFTVTFEPADDVTLKKENAKAGYLLKVKAGKSLPVGQFAEAVTFKCRASKEAELRIELRGNRPGPLTIVGKGFATKIMTWEIGTFDARKGYKQTLSLFYDNGTDSELKLEEVESTPPGIIVNLKRDEKFQGSGNRQRYLADVEIPPSDRAQIFNEGKSAILTLKTNSEEIGNIVVRMRYNALLN